MKTVGFHTLGCKLNFSETSTIAREFERQGFVRVSEHDPADISVVNSCSVTAEADKKCRYLIRKIHRRNPAAMIVVTGCYAQLKAAEIAAIEGVSLVVGNRDKGALVKRVMENGELRIENGEWENLFSTFNSPFSILHSQFFPAYSSGERTRSFLKVQDGCDYKCAYCTIHYARGASRNQPVAELIAQARQIAAAGQKEIVVTGINTGDFGRTTGETFLQLLQALDGVEGIERYRISSIEPNLLTDEIIDFCAAHPKFQPHFHIPLQSGSDEVLGRMRRRYTAAKFAERIAAVRAKMPAAFIGIDVIVGFPGETAEAFEQTRELLERLRPCYLHIFPYSARPGTPAAEMPDQVPEVEKTARAARLDTLCRELHGEFCKRAENTVADVLFESTVRGGMMFGYTGNYIRVKVPADPAKINTICSVRLDNMDENHDLTGNIL